MTWRAFIFLLLGCICSTSPSAAENIPGATADINAVGPLSDYRDVLLGDWGGRRKAMSNAGYDWEIVYTLDLLGKISPPGQKTYGLDNLDIKLALDGERIAGLKGSSALLYVLSNRGGKPVAQSDHSAGLDNIETPRGANTTKLYQAWIHANFFG